MTDAELNAAKAAWERLRGWARPTFDALYGAKPHDGTDAGMLRSLADVFDRIDDVTDIYYGGSGPVGRDVQRDLRRIADGLVLPLGKS